MTNKLKYFIANWKMFGDLASLKSIKKINHYTSLKEMNSTKFRIILCIPSTLIYYFKKKIESKFISFGAQNCHHMQKYGPYTGSISSYMLKNAGAKYVILGHSENRTSGENYNIIHKKIECAINQNLNVIFCVGENLKDKSMNKTFSVIKSQINGSIKKKYSLSKIFIAYEPIWSIGSGRTPTIKDLKKISLFIKNFIKKKLKTKNYPVVLYGGSVNAKNIADFSSISNIDGFLIGGASQSPKKFIDIIKNYYK
jgi:triosephosphate isomerase (TIM)